MTRLAYALLAYWFVGFVMMGSFVAAMDRKCGPAAADDISGGEILVGSIAWLPVTIGYTINSRGLSSWDKSPCPAKKAMERR